jgi:hypothetical protein
LFLPKEQRAALWERFVARKRKTYQTSLGFFDQAIRRSVDEGGLRSAGCRQQSLPPGSGEGEPRRGHHRGDYGEARRSQTPCGIRRPFSQHAELPKNLGEGGGKRPSTKPSGRRPKKSSTRPDKAADRKAAQAYEQERQRRQREESREEVARKKQRERRQQAVDKAQKALDEAKKAHTQRATALHAEIHAVENKLSSENAEWDNEERRLKAALRRAGE